MRWKESGMCDVHTVYTAEAAVGANYVVISLSSCQRNKLSLTWKLVRHDALKASVS